MTELCQLQVRLVHMLGQLYCWCATHGINVKLGGAWRDAKEAAANAATGAGIAASLHCDRLAQDLIRVDDAGKVMDRFEDYAPMGEYWESIGGSWGGRIKLANGLDIGHFSLAYGGRR